MAALRTRLSSRRGQFAAGQLAEKPNVGTALAGADGEGRIGGERRHVRSEMPDTSAQILIGAAALSGKRSKRSRMAISFSDKRRIARLQRVRMAVLCLAGYFSSWDRWALLGVIKSPRVIFRALDEADPPWHQTTRLPPAPQAFVRPLFFPCHLQPCDGLPQSVGRRRDSVSRPRVWARGI